MNGALALCGATIFDGDRRYRDHALLLRHGRVEAIRPVAGIGADHGRLDLGGGLLAPGFVDIQVNGGGGTLFNADPSVEGIRAICAAHARAGGSTALLPTVITDRPEITFAAIAAAERAMADGVPGCAGIHVEGPFLSLARKGAHDPALIRAMTPDDLSRIAGSTVRPFLLTVAPENVTNEQIARLDEAGIHVFLGHTDCDYETARAAFAAGARGVTHLFNAMSQLAHRAPGLVGAALETETIACGFIPDGHHVHPAALSAALRAKRGPGTMLAVSDAMPTVGWREDRFRLSGRDVVRKDGRLTLSDGTLAGSDLSMVGALGYLVGVLGVPEDEALRMCARDPAAWMGLADRGHLRPGARADIVHLNADRSLSRVWIGGTAVE